jgi:cbb3-type cytochrome oxidase maturation protein
MGNKSIEAVMEIISILLPLALGLGALFVAAFLWAVKKGQYDDVETPKYRMLLDDLETQRKRNGK